MVFEMKEGDTGPSLRVTLLDAKLKRVPITGATVRFRMAPVAAGLREPIDADAAVFDEALSVVEYVWAEGDTDVPGLYRADFFVLFGGTGPGESFPNDEDITVQINPKP